MRARLVLVSAASLLASCVTVYEDEEDRAREERAQVDALSRTVVIPIGEAPSAAERPLVELYEGVLARLQAAYRERDLASLRSLLDAYDREGLPTWARMRLAGYHALAAGLAFELHAIASASLAVVPPPPPALPADAAPEAEAAAPADEPGATMGEPLRFELALPADAEPTRLGGAGDDDPVAFGVAIDVEDRFADGSVRRHRDRDLVRLPAALVLESGVVLRLPIALDLPDSGAVRRTVHVQADLMPGYIGRRGIRAPVQRTRIAASTRVQRPPGHAALAKEPLRFMGEAMRIGDEARFRHVAVAAALTAGADRERALALLVDWVRLGNPDQSQVAQATLQELTKANVAVGDRDGWLAWWQARQ